MANNIISPLVFPLPFSLNCPCKIVRNLKAWLGYGSREKRLPLLSSDYLLHHVIHSGSENCLPFFGADSGGCDLRLGMPIKDLWPNVLKVVKPSSLIEPLPAAASLGLSFWLIQQRHINANIFLRSKISINLIPNFLPILCRMEFFLHRKTAPYHVTAKGEQSVSYTATRHLDCANQKVSAGSAIVLKGKAARFIGKNIGSRHVTQSA